MKPRPSVSLKRSRPRAQVLEVQLRQAEADRSIWEQLAAEAEQSNAELARRLVGQQEQAKAAPTNEVQHYFVAADVGAKKIALDEFETRKPIDQQLRTIDVDVLPIVNVVFLRKVSSCILFEKMKGERRDLATRSARSLSNLRCRQRAREHAARLVHQLLATDDEASKSEEKSCIL